MTKEETLLKEKKDLEKQLSEMKIKLDEKVDGSQLLEIQAEKSQIQERLQEQIAMCEAIQNELDVSLAANNDLETELKENYSVHLQELKKKEVNVEHGCRCQFCPTVCIIISFGGIIFSYNSLSLMSILYHIDHL